MTVRVLGAFTRPPDSQRGHLTKALRGYFNDVKTFSEQEVVPGLGAVEDYAESRQSAVCERSKTAWDSFANGMTIEPRSGCGSFRKRLLDSVRIRSKAYFGPNGTEERTW